MDNMTPTFEQLPQAVAMLIQKMDLLISLFQQCSNASNTSPMAQNRHRLMDAEEASKFIGKAIPTLYAMTSRHEIPFCKKRNKLYFFEDELTAWIEGNGEYAQTTRDQKKEENFESHHKKILQSKRRKPKNGFDDDTI